jgi:uracil-DNA glycosylase
VKPLAQLIDPGWAAALAPVEPQIRAMGDFLRAQPAYLPAGADVLRAFTYPFDAAEVLIVGQDPYPTPGHPIGLEFRGGPGRPAAAAEPAQHLHGAGVGSRGAQALQW